MRSRGILVSAPEDELYVQSTHQPWVRSRRHCRGNETRFLELCVMFKSEITNSRHIGEEDTAGCFSGMHRN